ncbi:hypothetical protein M5K25_002375 [Dendrobium thyrsiflorum]|uniref:Filament-like plant protein 3 n=1 Tax=Dendrobium thyrsiflorum TaxID=117978 RepID=A0ABD0VMA7_DENTH
MDRRSWLWRRKSSETESSGSASSHSERFSEDQEGMRVYASPNHARSPELSSKLTGYDPNETIKSLHEKLSAALLSINAKEELVRKHVKVAEEAVAGWEKAEADVSALKKQVEVVLQKNSALEDGTKQLDAALKECVRQLKQSRKEREQNFCETIAKKTKEWEDEKFELETQIMELQAKLDVKAETAFCIDHQVFLKLQELEEEKSSLQIELLAKTEDLHFRTLERDLSAQAAETASKQHLESIKKLAKLEAECLRFRAASRKCSPLNDHFKQQCSDQKPFTSSVCVESLTDSQADIGKRLITLDNEPSRSDSRASSLIVEPDPFKNDKATKRNLTASTIKIDLMDDFLEMEMLAAMPEAGHESSSFDIDGDSDLSVTRDGPSRMEVEVMHRQLAELKQKIAKFETEKVEMEMTLSESRNQLKVTSDNLIIADKKLIELQQELSAANGSKLIFDVQMEEVDAKRKELESQLEAAQLEISKLNEKASFFERNCEKAVSVKLESKFKEMESVEAERKALAFQLKMAQSDFRKLHMSVDFLEKEIDKERKSSSEYLTRCRDMEIINIKSREMETQLISANREVNELNIKVHTLEVKLKEEEALSAMLAANMVEVEANMKTLGTQQESANVESMKLKERIKLLEEEVEQERTLSAELAAKYQHLKYQLNSADFETRQQHEKVKSLERIIDEERALLTEFKAQAEASMEAKKTTWESQMRSAQFEVEDLHKKADLLERKGEEERAISAGLAASREELEIKLESAHLEVQRLQDKVSSLRQEVDKERSMFAELSIKKQDDKLLFRKEKDFIMDSEEFAACQKTIDSISQQLKVLSNFENLMLESDSCGPSSSYSEC